MKNDLTYVLQFLCIRTSTVHSAGEKILHIPFSMSPFLSSLRASAVAISTSVADPFCVLPFHHSILDSLFCIFHSGIPSSYIECITDAVAMCGSGDTGRAEKSGGGGRGGA